LSEVWRVLAPNGVEGPAVRRFVRARLQSSRTEPRKEGF
jgi:hypothetical protein